MRCSRREGAFITVVAVALVVLGASGFGAAAAEAAPTCYLEPATIVGTEGGDRSHGTHGTDVVVAGGGDDRIAVGGGDDIVAQVPVTTVSAPDRARIAWMPVQGPISSASAMVGMGPSVTPVPTSCAAAVVTSRVGLLISVRSRG